MALFALDEGFPDTIFTVAKLLPGLELRPLREVDERLVGNSDDWAILLRLHQMDEKFDGLITVDSSMAALTRELSVLHQTGLTLVVLEEAGDDPVRASGLCLLHLPYIAEATIPGEPQLWQLRAPARRSPQKAWARLGEIASKQGSSIQGVFDQERLSPEELGSDLWDWYSGIEEAI